ncbi:protein kinase [Candidatus Woesearchaeota archaeon]|nr:protein kinase [Candidatus Woesearchaeota archaeon]MBW2994129.1 protein kinase [Candidatus Woesearchaeota archaeon]
MSKTTKDEPKTLEVQISQMSKGGAAFGMCTTVTQDSATSEASLAEKLLDRGTKKAKKNKKPCLRIKSKNTNYNVTIPVHAGTRIPERLFGVGGQGGAFKAKIDFNLDTCAEIYAHWKAITYIEEELTPDELYAYAEKLAKKREAARKKREKPVQKNLLQRMREAIFKPKSKQENSAKKEEKLAEAKWKIWKEKVRKYKLDTKKIPKKELVKMIQNEFGADFPDGNCVAKLYNTNPGTKHLPVRERKLLARKHPQMAYPLVSGAVVSDDSDGNGMHFAVYPIVDNQMSDEKIKRLGYKKRIDVGIQALKILKTGLHPLGLVHRDLKPPNLLIKDDGTVILIDFGLMQDEKYNAETLQTQANGAFFGTVGFGAPEQVPGSATERAKVTWKADQYSAAALIYYNLIGLPPNPLAKAGYAGVSNLKVGHYKALLPSASKKLNGLVNTLASQNKFKAKQTAKIPEYVDLVMAKMMQHNPDDRYSTIDECLRDLEAVHKGEAPKIILNELKKHNISPTDYKEDKFAHYVEFYENDVYIDEDPAAAQEKEKQAVKRQQIARSWQNLRDAKANLGVVRRFGSKIAAGVLSAAAAGAVYTAVEHPELMNTLWDAIGLPYIGK